jgi:hypothetical protein
MKKGKSKARKRVLGGGNFGLLLEGKNIIFGEGGGG